MTNMTNNMATNEPAGRRPNASRRQRQQAPAPQVHFLTDEQRAAFLILSGVTQAKDGVARAKNTLGALFAAKAYEYAHDPRAAVSETDGGKQSYSAPQFEQWASLALREGLEACGLTVAEITGTDAVSKAKVKAMRPTQWTQYTSDVKVAIANGLMAELSELHTTDPVKHPKLGMYALKQAKIAAASAERKAADKAYAAKARFSAIVGKIGAMKDDDGAKAELVRELTAQYNAAAAELEALYKKLCPETIPAAPEPTREIKGDERTGTQPSGTVDTHDMTSSEQTGREGIAGERNPEPVPAKGKTKGKGRGKGKGKGKPDLVDVDRDAA